MSTHIKFPPSNEIKRMISAAKKAGLPIGPVEIRAAGMTIHPPTTASGGSAYDH